jgi:hypothetical protein
MTEAQGAALLGLAEGIYLALRYLVILGGLGLGAVLLLAYKKGRMG